MDPESVLKTLLLCNVFLNVTHLLTEFRTDGPWKCLSECTSQIQDQQSKDGHQQKLCICPSSAVDASMGDDDFRWHCFRCYVISRHISRRMLIRKKIQAVISLPHFCDKSRIFPWKKKPEECRTWVLENHFLSEMFSKTASKELSFVCFGPG